MKKLMLIFITICLIVFSSSVFGDIKHLTYPISLFDSTALVNTATNKNPVDTIFADFTNYPEFLDGGSMLIYIQFDSIAGLYGGQSADSLGRNAVRVRYQPVVRYPTQERIWETQAINSTIYGVSATDITDSVTVFGSLLKYIVPLQYHQYYIYIDHAYDDTSAINPQASTSYKGMVILRKLNVIRIIETGYLGPIDTVGSGTGNKYEADTVKIDLSGYNLRGFFELKFSFDTTGTANTQGRMPSMGLGFGNWDYARGKQLFHQDSTTTEYHVLEDSSKQYNRMIRFGVDEFFAISAIELTDGIMIIIKNTEADTSKVAYDRKIPWLVELLGR